MTPTLYILTFINTILSFIRIVLSSKIKITFPVIYDKNLHILGNGPSLADVDFQNLKGDLMAVNNFAFSEKYQETKPLYYIINAPEFWMENVDDEYKSGRKNLTDALVKKTDWNVNFLVPVEAKNSGFTNDLMANNNLSIFYYNITSIEGFSVVTSSFYNNKLGMPRPHNVLIPSIMNGIWMGYNSIFIHGADHSWLKDIYVSQDNKVFLTQKHFYDFHSAKPEVMKKLGKGQRKMHEILEKFVLTFKGYHEINEFANRKKIKIFNCTKDSFIDAFERFTM